jgi:hypothetical protein
MSAGGAGAANQQALEAVRGVIEVQLKRCLQVPGELVQADEIGADAQELGRAAAAARSAGELSPHAQAPGSQRPVSPTS